jgi:hypothetical protein
MMSDCPVRGRLISRPVRLWSSATIERITRWVLCGQEGKDFPCQANRFYSSPGTGKQRIRRLQVDWSRKLLRERVSDLSFPTPT